MTNYFLSPSLARLRSEVNTLWPNRDKSSDGWIGDLAHASRTSDHNPDANGSVNALDIDKDGINVDALISAVISDGRTNYLIYNRRMWLSSTKRWHAYTGSNPHTKHVHVSIKHGNTYENDTRPWGIAVAVSNPGGSNGPLPGVPTVTPPTPLVPEEDIMATLEQLEKVVAAKTARVAFRIPGTYASYVGEGGERIWVTQAQIDEIPTRVEDLDLSDAFWLRTIATIPGEVYKPSDAASYWVVERAPGARVLTRRWVQGPEWAELKASGATVKTLNGSHPVWKLPVVGKTPAS